MQAVSFFRTILILLSFNYYCFGEEGQRDGSLLSLANQINSQQDLFRKWIDKDANYVHFFRHIEPWIMSNFSRPLTNITNPLMSLDCKNPHYSGVLSGNSLPTPRIIVDFIPFGYEMDKFFVRLYETSPYVDAFVVYEMSRTITAGPKSLYFSKLKKSGRLNEWINKIIHFSSHDAEIADIVQKTRIQVDNKRKRKPFDHDDLFALMDFMRTKMIEKFKNLDPKESPLKARIMAGLDTALGIQNDADELIKGEVLYHLKHCELRKEVQGIYTPAFQFKRNFHWMEPTSDLGCLSQPSFPLQQQMSLFTSHLWRPGPYLYPLSLMIDKGHTNRLHKFDSNFFCTHHMGIGAAVHMSSFTDPVDLWMKRCAVIEEDCRHTFDSEFITAASNGRITPDIIFRNSVSGLCTMYSNRKMLQVLNLNNRERSVFEASVPWIIRQNPNSFPFMLPAHVTDDKIGGIIKTYGNMSWEDVCQRVLYKKNEWFLTFPLIDS